MAMPCVDSGGGGGGGGGCTSCPAAPPKNTTRQDVETSTQTNAPASAAAQPSGGHRHQRRASQRCSFEWRRHPLWASCRANCRIKRASRDGDFESSRRRPEAKGGFGGGCRGVRVQKKFGPKSGCSAKVGRGPQNGGADVGTAGGGWRADDGWRADAARVVWVHAGSRCVAPGAVSAASRQDAGCSGMGAGNITEGTITFAACCWHIFGTRN